jgi:hypothetical protein
MLGIKVILASAIQFLLKALGLAVKGLTNFPLHFNIHNKIFVTKLEVERPVIYILHITQTEEY